MSERQGDTLTSVAYGSAMPARHTLHVALTEPLVRYVRDQVAAGRHQTASDVVRTALQGLMQRDKFTKRPIGDATPGPQRHD